VYLTLVTGISIEKQSFHSFPSLAFPTDAGMHRQLLNSLIADFHTDR
jgi:hypothetical protein